MCGIVHIVKMIEIKKHNLVAVFLKKCSQAVQTAFDRRTVKSVDNKQIRCTRSTADSDVEVTHTGPQLGLNPQ